MIAAFLYISGLAFMGFMGVIVGAGLMQAAQRDRDAKRTAERAAELEAVSAMVDAIETTHHDVEAMINQTAELAAYNAQILAVLQRGATTVFATTGRPN